MTTDLKNIRYIVRIANKDIDGTLPIERALIDIKGVGHRFAKAVAYVFEKEYGISADTLVGTLDEGMQHKLEDIILRPQEHGMPNFMLNRRKDFADNKDKHLVMGDLDFTVREDIKRLAEIKSYRGLRHTWGLPVRGQRTKSTHRERGKGHVIGVLKKEAKAAAAKSTAAKSTAKPAEKKK